MADPIPYTTNTHFPFSTIQPKPITKGNSFSLFLFKVLFFALFIIAVPLFPSQAPLFVNHTLLTTFWDLIHLLFIGIAVAYGLFSRRNVEQEIIDIETESSVVSGTASYVSKLFPVSTIFDENENLCGFDEKRVVHCWNPQYFDGGAVDVFDEEFETQLPISEDNFNYSVGFDGTNVVQAWNSEKCESEPVVFVAQPCYTIGECGEAVGYKPLGLPVRSLRLVSEGVDGVKYSNESDSSSGSRGSCKSSVKSRDREFRDMGHSVLERKFNDDDAAGGASASPIPWRSKSRKMGGEKGYGNVTYPMHLRPDSVDETKFEALGLRPLPSITPFSSHVAMYSSLNSTSPDNVNFHEVEMGKGEPFYVAASEKMNFQEEYLRQENTSFVPGSENMSFEEEDFRQSKTLCVPGSENLVFREVDLRKKKLRGSSSRNGKMATKGKRAAASSPSHFRPMSVVETQFESLTSRPFQSVDSLSLHPSMYSSVDSSISDNDIEQNNTSYMHSSENMHFREEDMGQKNTFYAHASQNVNFQEENLRQRKTRYVPASENMIFQAEDTALRKTSCVHASENANFQQENLGQRKTSYVPASENTSFEEEVMGQKKTFYVHASENMIFEEENMGQQKTSSVPASENMNFQEGDLRKISRKPSSRNGRRETKGKSAAISYPSHMRQMSVDEPQFESLSSCSFQYTESFSSRTNLSSNSSSENMNLLKEDFGEKKSSCCSSSSSSSPPDRKNNEPVYSNESLLQGDIQSNPSVDSGDFNETQGEEDRRGNKKSGMRDMLSDSEKPASLPKIPSRGKSVRTRRASGLSSGLIRIGELSNKQIDVKVENKPNIVEAASASKDKMKSGEPNFLFKATIKKTLDSYCPPKPVVILSNRRIRDKLEPSKNVSYEDSDVELENIQLSSNEDVVSEHVNDSELDSEVDKKASEFIAKFKAQIRLQKMGSIDRSRRQKTIGNFVR